MNMLCITRFTLLSLLVVSLILNSAKADLLVVQRSGIASRLLVNSNSVKAIRSELNNAIIMGLVTGVSDIKIIDAGLTATPLIAGSVEPREPVRFEFRLEVMNELSAASQVVIGHYVTLRLNGFTQATASAMAARWIKAEPFDPLPDVPLELMEPVDDIPEFLSFLQGSSPDKDKMDQVVHDEKYYLLKDGELAWLVVQAIDSQPAIIGFDASLMNCSGIRMAMSSFLKENAVDKFGSRQQREDAVSSYLKHAWALEWIPPSAVPLPLEVMK